MALRSHLPDQRDGRKIPPPAVSGIVQVFERIYNQVLYKFCLSLPEGQAAAAGAGEAGDKGVLGF